MGGSQAGGEKKIKQLPLLSHCQQQPFPSGSYSRFQHNPTCRLKARMSCDDFTHRLEICCSQPAGTIRAIIFRTTALKVQYSQQVRTFLRLQNSVFFFFFGGKSGTCDSFRLFFKSLQGVLMHCNRSKRSFSSMNMNS